MTQQEAPTEDSLAESRIAKALVRFRVMAYIVGFALLGLLVAMGLRLTTDITTPSAIIAPAHGFLYMVYLVAAFDLAQRCKWSAKGTLLVLIAGTIPFVSFYAEKQVVRRVQAGEKL
ncbi:DUF3817 domain-containing protein [Allokutzneria multivorans]|uniref:DUF3817 domain-containing protein n=1 Tax=Allokutzneria multivorans TaxID=1142134 RepID=A0ABP7S8E1_9PSEU